MHLVSVEEFLERDPENMEYAEYLKSFLRKGVHAIGFIKWNDEDADSWGGPWPGNLVLVSIIDARISNPAALVPKGTYEDIPTIECPIKLYLCGNDDTSYSCFLASIDEAEKIVESLATTPTWKNLNNLGFVFTN